MKLTFYTVDATGKHTIGDSVETDQLDYEPNHNMFLLVQNPLFAGPELRVSDYRSSTLLQIERTLIIHPQSWSTYQIVLGQHVGRRESTPAEMATAKKQLLLGKKPLRTLGEELNDHLGGLLDMFIDPIDGYEKCLYNYKTRGHNVRMPNGDTEWVQDDPRDDCELDLKVQFTLPHPDKLGVEQRKLFQED